MRNTEIMENTIRATYTAAELSAILSAFITPEKLAARAACISIEYEDGHTATDAEKQEEALYSIAPDFFHTFQGWKKAGYSVKKGAHAAFTARLWKYDDRKVTVPVKDAKTGETVEDEQERGDYYKSNAYIFFFGDVERTADRKRPTYTKKTPADIAAYNAMLSAQRKARKAAAQAAASPVVTCPPAALQGDALKIAACNAFLSNGGRYPAAAPAKRYNNSVSKSQRLAAIKRIANGSDHKEINGIFRQDDGHGASRHCVCSGYHAIRLLHDVPEIQPAAGSIDLVTLCNGAARDTLLVLPALADLRKFIDDANAAFRAETTAAQRRHSTNKRMIYTFPGTDLHVNARFLLDILTVLDEPAAYLPKDNRSPIYFTGRDGDALLLPVRVSK